MDGVKRVASILGNRLANEMDVKFYTLADIEPFYELNAPLIIAKRPLDSNGISFRGDKPLTRLKDQIDDLIEELQVGYYDAVILTAGCLTSFIPLIKNKIPNIRAIAWMHNNVDTYLNNYYIYMKKEFIGGLEKADGVVVLTDYDLLGFLPYNPKTIKIYNPLTIEATGYSNLETHNIAFTGRIDIQQKGIDYLIDVASKLPDDWKITIAGDGREKAMNDFEQLRRQKDVTDKITYLGRLKDAELQQHYLNASLFVMTSRWEGLPLVLGEAMSFGLPIATMYSTGADEYLDGGKYGLLLDGHNVDEFIQKILPVLNDQGIREQFAKRSLERVRDFQMENIVDQWKSILE
ncbi:hypothetical protein IV79_GL001731 [Pediococcus claussenii]|nr:hypothetical protein IV79_GL001731 [Pediococcus claussenii]